MRSSRAVTGAFHAIETLRLQGRKVFLDSDNRIHVRPGAEIDPGLRQVLVNQRRHVVWLLQQAEQGRGISYEEWYLSLPVDRLRNPEAQAA